MKIHMITDGMAKDANPSSGDFLDGYLLYLLARASSVASGQFHEELAGRGVPVLTWRILAVLHDGPATVGRLAEATLTKQTTLSKALDRLERDGLIRRTRATGDRRQVLVEKTGKGAIWSIDLIQRAKRHQDNLLSDYSPEEQQTLIHALRGFLDLAENSGAEA